MLRRIAWWVGSVLVVLLVALFILPATLVMGHKTWRWATDDLGITAPEKPVIIAAEATPLKKTIAAKPATPARQRVEIVVKAEPQVVPAAAPVIAAAVAPAPTALVAPQAAPAPSVPTFFMGAETPQFISWMNSRGCRITETYSPVSHKWHCDDTPQVIPAPAPK